LPAIGSEKTHPFGPDQAVDRRGPEDLATSMGSAGKFLKLDRCSPTAPKGTRTHQVQSSVDEPEVDQKGKELIIREAPTMVIIQRIITSGLFLA